MADDKSEIQLKITLDDGSIVQGFLNINKKAESTGKKVESEFSKGVGAIKEGLEEVAPEAVSVGKRLVSALSSPLGLITASVVALGASVKGAFDLTIEGEKLNKLDKQFAALSGTFGVAGEALKTQFIDSLGGLVDDSDAIQSLNKAFVTLGDKVTQLPAVMDIARKATNLFGGDVTQNFEAINQAIATGATRQLRGLGIIIDSDQAYKNYAKSIGVSVDVLSESGKQQAILNEVLAKGGEKFKNVSAESGGAIDAYQRFKVAAGNAFEEIAKRVAENLSPAFTLALNAATGFFNDFGALFKKPTNDVEKFTGRQEVLTKELEKWQAVLARGPQNGILNAIFGDGYDEAKKKVSELTIELSGISSRIEEAQRELSKTPDASAPKPSSVDVAKDAEKKKQIELEFSNFKFAQLQAQTNAEIEQRNILLKENLRAGQKLEILDKNFADKKLLSDEQLGKDILAIQQKFKDAGTQFDAEKNAEIELLKKTHNDQMSLLEKQRITEESQLREQEAFDRLNGFQQSLNSFSIIGNRFAESAKKFSQNTIVELRKLGAAFLDMSIRGIAMGAQKMGEALRNSEDAAQAFINVMGNMLADVAGAFGEFFIKKGVADIASGNVAMGSAEIAAGLALNLFSGYTKASIGGGSSSASSSAGIGGGISTSPSYGTDQPTTVAERQKPQTVVNYTVQGSIFDTKEAGLRMADLLNAVSSDGVIINQRAFA